MSITTITIIIAGAALALAAEATILHVLAMRRINRELAAIRDEVAKPRTNALSLLLDKFTPADDYQEDLQAPVTTTDATQPEPQDTGQPQPHMTTTEADFLRLAYEKFYKPYVQLTNSLEVGTLDEQSQRQAALLLEMGLWLKDFLPVSQLDPNATETQKTNAESVGYDDLRLAALLASGEKPTENPFKTPLEVIGLVRQLRRLGVTSLPLLLSGYRYEPSAPDASR